MLKAKRLYLDAAAATPISTRAKKELVRLLDVYGNAGALHHEAIEAKRELEAARAAIAEAIGAHPDEIIFTASGTEGNNLAIEGILRPLLIEHGELHAVTTAIEHMSVIEPLRALDYAGLYTTELPVDHEGRISTKALEEAINDETVFVSVQLVNSEIGTVQPLRDIAKVIRRVRKNRGETSNQLPLYIHCDASQAPLWLPLAVDSLGIDLLTLDAQKVGGPKGIGALYVRRKTSIEPVIRGGVQEFGLRGGTPNVPLAGAFAVALTDAAKGVEARAVKVAKIRDALWCAIQRAVPDAVLNGPELGDRRVANNLNISIPGLEAEMGVLALDAMGIAASTRSACKTDDIEPSHVIAALGTPKELAQTAIRFALLPEAKSADMPRVATALAEIAKRYRNVV